MQLISEWEARRAGGRITINGKDQDGKAIKVTCIDAIEKLPDAPFPIATRNDGSEYELV